MKAQRQKEKGEKAGPGSKAGKRRSGEKEKARKGLWQKPVISRKRCFRKGGSKLGPRANQEFPRKTKLAGPTRVSTSPKPEKGKGREL